MFQNLTLFQHAGALARHSAARQSIVARNVANVDTPGYKAEDMKGFAEVLSNHMGKSGPRSTRELHVIRGPSQSGYEVVPTSTSEAKPNGNTVSIEAEMLKAVEVERRHSRALAVYQASLDILKTSIGRGR